ncbi:MAG: hypothetical protein HY901_34925 [Deltaproteobacteria bacterium]|nr:hypothetical protein [Deltaproteobacteria bacterium]
MAALLSFLGAGSGCATARMGEGAALGGMGGPMSLAGVTVYQSSEGPLAYESPAGRDARRALPARRVQGRACQSGVQLPLGFVFSLWDIEGGAVAGLNAAWGEGGFRAAMASAQAQAPDALLYDVRADLKIVSVLSVWHRQCVVVTASVAAPP